MLGFRRESVPPALRLDGVYSEVELLISKRVRCDARAAMMQMLLGLPQCVSKVKLKFSLFT